MTTRRYGRYRFDASNEDKLLFPDAGLTKGDLIDYHERIAEHMIRHLRDRPISMQRFPDGIDADGFYEKKAPDHFPDWIHRVTVRTHDGSQRQIACDNQATLAYLANQACITPHVWLSLADDLDKPDRMIFDLDPPDGENFNAVREAARRFRELFDELSITALVKTTGSRGLHLVIPLKRDHGFDAVRNIARKMADVLARRHAETLTTEVRKNKRRGRLFLDTARNAYGQTATPPYAVRAKRGAPVAAPITWDEVDDRNIEAQSFTVANIFRRLGRRGDIWSDLGRHRQSLDRIGEQLNRG